MILLCPFCGTRLNTPLNDGVASCNHCQRVFTSNIHNKILAASWYLREHSATPEKLKTDLKLTDAQAIFVYTFVNDNGYSHDELIKALKELGIKDTVDLV